jgi:signal transduction histidine kinase
VTEQPASILIVDDTIENLRLLAALLGERGFEARPVRSGAEALEAAKHAAPDLILLDITMPGMDGYETCTRLKSMPGLADVPIIFITALGELADKVKAFEVGGADYITKPFQIEEVLARVRVHMALRKAQVELAQNYDRLRSLEQLRDELIHMVVHDMRSPLTVVLAQLQFIHDDISGVVAEPVMKDLDAAIQAAGVINRMANDLLDVSRMEEGKLPLNRQATDLAQLARAVQTAISGWQRGRTMDVDAPGPVPADCDPEIVRRVLENLVSNAIKHTPEDGTITIALTPGSPSRVAVMDRGPGVPAQARDRIFEKFGTLATRQSQTYHSAGLGLAFCKLAVEAHGGRIGIDDRDGGGSVFWFELPAG